MALPSYGRDPFSQLNRLLDGPHTAPGSIRKTCLAVEECLACNRDNLRGFFAKPFANLLKRAFGYGDFEASWLNIVTKGRDADARALVDLLAPDGKLFAAMAQADNDRLVQYIFPTERLPAHTQELLKEPNGLGLRLLDTWPQYRGRIRQDAAGRPQVYLNLFEYFMFWTAFYVLRGSASDGGRNDPRAPSPSSTPTMYGGFRSVGSAIVGNLILGRHAGTLQSHCYYQLLRTYLEYFLPRSAGGVGDPAAAARSAAAIMSAGGAGLGGSAYGNGLGPADLGGSGAGWASYKPALTAAAAGSDSRGAVLLSVLVEFWLTDVAEPLPSPVLDRVSGVGGVQPGGAAAAFTGLLGGAGLGGMGSPVGVAGSAAPTPVAVATPPNVRMLAYQPPSEELVEALVVLVRYVNVIEPADPGRAANGAAASGGGVLRAGGGGMSASGSASAGRAVAGGTGGRGGSAPVVQLQPAQVGRPPWLPETPVKSPPLPPPRLLVPPTALVVQGSSASAAVQAVARKVYRQLRRSFSQWPPSSSASLTPLVTLWLSVIAPWCPVHAHTRKAAPAADAVGAAAAGAVGGGGGSSAGGGGGHHSPLHVLDGAAAAAAGVVEATAAKLHLPGVSGRDRDREPAEATCRELLSQYKYTPAWRSHVLAHLPFYLQLLPAFAALSLSRLKYRPDSALRDLDRVMAVLAAAGPELLRELAAAEAAINDFARPAAAAAARRRSDGELGEMVPWWLEQAQDFEAAAASGSSPGAVQPDVMGRLFTTDSGGAAYTTCILLRSAETLGRPELVSALRQSAGAVLPLDSILPAAVEQPRPAEGSAAAFQDAKRFPRPGRWSSLFSSLLAEDPRLADPQRLWLRLYRGSDGRHDPLLRPIASNELACLVRPLVRASMRANAALGLDVPYRAGEEREEPPEHLGQQALLWARRRGYRINLRVFAEVQTLVWLLGLLLLAFTLLRACGAGAGGAVAAAAGAGGSAAGGAGTPGGALHQAGGIHAGPGQGGGYNQQRQHHASQQQQQWRQAYEQRYQMVHGAGAGAGAGGAGQQQQQHVYAGRADPGLEDAAAAVDGGYRFN